MTRASPSSSPRLPSPPPMAEDQLGPMSPIAALREDHGQGGMLGTLDQGAERRIRPGTKAAEMAEGPPLVDITEIESAFQLTEHLKALHYNLTHPPETPDLSRPLDRNLSMRLAEPPEGVDKHLWLYELCRFLSQKANSIVVALFSDSPACSAHTCPEMRASEWQYLCAVHDPPKSCSAIDYCCHTLDWAANTLTSPKNFPSRLALFGPASTSGIQTENGVASTTSNPGMQLRHLTNIFRRVYRIFAHAWFSHRDQFWKVENRTGLYVLFKTVCDAYNLIPADNYTIPDEAEGLGEWAGENDDHKTAGGAHESSKTTTAAAPQSLRRDEATEDAEPAGNQMLSTGNTTKRHRASPSSSSVSMVIEEAEEDEDDSAGGGGAKASAAATAMTTAAKQETSDIPDSSDEVTPVEPRRPGLSAEQEEQQQQQQHAPSDAAPPPTVAAERAGEPGGAPADASATPDPVVSINEPATDDKPSTDEADSTATAPTSTTIDASAETPASEEAKEAQQG